MEGMHELRFVNSDARPKETILLVGYASVRPIMAWYGAYHSGDRYQVLLDGRPLEKDQNGEMVGVP